MYDPRSINSKHLNVILKVISNLFQKVEFEVNLNIGRRPRLFHHQFFAMASRSPAINWRKPIPIHRNTESKQVKPESQSTRTRGKFAGNFVTNSGMTFEERTVRSTTQSNN